MHWPEVPSLEGQHQAQGPTTVPFERMMRSSLRGGKHQLEDGSVYSHASPTREESNRSEATT